MQILITGSQGFLGSNLKLFLQERNHTVIEFNRSHSKEKLTSSLQGLDCIVHLAGVNRNDKEQLLNLNRDLKLVVYGQDEAVSELSDAIKLYEASMYQPFISDPRSESHAVLYSSEPSIEVVMY